MAIADSVLPKPMVVLSLSDSISSITAIYSFGTVYKIYETSDSFAVGDSVLFNKTKATQIGDGTGDYYLISEDDLLLKETEAPLPP